jgi:predicted dehydrogenase
VLCEKPLAMNAQEAEEMATTARQQGRLLMEAFMYRFHPKIKRLIEEVREPRFLHASVGFQMTKVDNYRSQVELGGGALMDVGCYCVDAARVFMGEPESVTAGVKRDGGRGVDITISAALRFSGERLATIWSSFDSPPSETLVLATTQRAVVEDVPFSDTKDPDTYQMMVEAFADSALSGDPEPLRIEDSVSTARIMDAIRAAAGL